ncbi:MAG: radical SAM family heme chaperone HemW [Gammaproteobacteria bacterium]
MITQKPPLSLYIHLPWCVRKCPYCDFNSHVSRVAIPQKRYIQRLLDDFETQLPKIRDREIQSIFFGGGTPSLFEADYLKQLFTGLFERHPFKKDCEITLEANPGTMEQGRFSAYREIGINRLSLGVQSFQDEKLQLLGRIHNSKQAQTAIAQAKESGFDNFNIDIMHGLPGQSVKDACEDLNTTIALNPTHISWYQLTFEPNTPFYYKKPLLPDEEILADIEQEGFKLLQKYDYRRYEVSAFSKPEKQCQHNVNYWTFGDYIGIGAGAHSKITQSEYIHRHWQEEYPHKYLNSQNEMTVREKVIPKDEIAFEFMLNHLRLHCPVYYAIFESRTGLAKKEIYKNLTHLSEKKLVSLYDDKFETTNLGKQFLDDVVKSFL